MCTTTLSGESQVFSELYRLSGIYNGASILPAIVFSIRSVMQEVTTNWRMLSSVVARYRQSFEAMASGSCGIDVRAEI